MVMARVWLFRLIPKILDPIEETLTAILRLESEVKSVPYNTVGKLAVTI